MPFTENQIAQIANTVTDAAIMQSQSKHGQVLKVLDSTTLEPKVQGSKLSQGQISVARDGHVAAVEKIQIQSQHEQDPKALDSKALEPKVQRSKLSQGQTSEAHDHAVAAAVINQAYSKHEQDSRELDSKAQDSNALEPKVQGSQLSQRQTSKARKEPSAITVSFFQFLTHKDNKKNVLSRALPNSGQ